LLSSRSRHLVAAILTRALYELPRITPPTLAGQQTAYCRRRLTDCPYIADCRILPRAPGS